MKKVATNQFDFDCKVDFDYKVDINYEYTQLMNDFIKNVENDTLDKYDIKWSGNVIPFAELNNNKNTIWRTSLKDEDNGKLKRADCIFAIQSKFIVRRLCKVFIGNTFIYEFILIPETVQWIFNGCPIFPIGLQYHEIHIELYDILTNKKIYQISNKITIYYCHFINNKIRCAIGQHGYSCDITDEYYFIALNGMGCISKEREKWKRKIHFNRLTPLQYFYNNDAYIKKIDFINKIRKELIEKAYHPSRYYNWCLDEDAKKTFTPLHI